jgi:CRISPR-associated protein Csx10
MNKTYTLELELLSDLLCATGESSALVDSYPTLDRYGLPYIHAKTMKGVLKDAAREVCDIRNEDYNKVVKLFGNDTNSGELKLTTLRIEKYETIRHLLTANSISRNDCVQFFTLQRRQTAIENGVAKKTSLRNYMLLKRNPYKLCCRISVPNQNEYIEFLDQVILEARHMGLRRNRGFGAIKLKLIPDLQEPQSNNIDKPYEPTERGEKSILEYCLHTLEPIHIGLPIGDQNTEATLDYIPGSNIRGIIASALLGKKQLKHAHKDGHFKSLILDDVIYENATIAINGTASVPASKALVHDTSDDNKIYNVLVDDVTVKTKRSSGWLSKVSDTHAVQVAKFHHFHHRRADRIKGKSDESDGAIYYYEYIEEGQTFRGKIVGSSSQLEQIKEILSENNFSIGASKSSSFCNVKFSDFNIITLQNEEPKIEKGTAYLVLESPAILYNENGVAEPTPEVLTNILKEKGIMLGDKLAAQTELVEGFYRPWNSNTDMDFAYAAGSTFTVTIGAEAVETGRIGERQMEGYGLYRLHRDLKNSKNISTALNADTKNIGLSKSSDDNKLLKDIQNHLNTFNKTQGLKSKGYELYEKHKSGNINNNNISVNIERLKNLVWEGSSMNFKIKDATKFEKEIEKSFVRINKEEPSFEEWRKTWIYALTYLRKKKN